MTVRGAWLLNSATTGQTPADTRLAPVGTWTPSADGRTLTAPTVYAGAASVGTLTPGAGMTATLAPIPVVIQGSAAGQGPYPVVVTQPEVLTFASGDPSNPRIDLVVVQVYDQLYDTSGQTAYAVRIVQGTPTTSPTAPAVPANACALYSVPIPAGASSSNPPNWSAASWLPRYLTAAAGGIMVATSVAGLPTGAYDGQYADVAGTLYRWSVSAEAWQRYPLGGWTQYTPVIGNGTILGNGSAVGRYRRTDTRVEVCWSVTWGSSTTASPTGFSLTLPTTSAASVNAWTGPVLCNPGGGAAFRDGLAFVGQSASQASALFARQADLHMTGPSGAGITMAQGGTMVGTLVYESAT